MVQKRAVMKISRKISISHLKALRLSFGEDKHSKRRKQKAACAAKQSRNGRSWLASFSGNRSHKVRPEASGLLPMARK
jgi:hypothetical protein